MLGGSTIATHWRRLCKHIVHTPYFTLSKENVHNNHCRKVSGQPCDVYAFNAVHLTIQ